MSPDEPRGLRKVFRLPASRSRVRNVVDDELRFHLDARVEELMAQGYDRERAQSEAARRFGTFDAYRRETIAIDDRMLQQRHRFELFDTLAREMRQAARVLLRSRGFTLTAITTLAVALGAATAIFAMLDAVVLRPLPYPDAERLVQLSSPVPKMKGDTLWGLARHEMFYFKQSSHTIEDIGVYQNSQFTVTGTDASHPAERVRTAQVSASLFHVLGIVPERGRLITLEDNRARPPAVLMLGHGFWQRRFGGDPNIIGKTIDIEGRPMTVIGVLPARAQLPDVEVDMWAPARVDPAAPPMNNHTWNAIAKLRPGFTVADAQRELATLTARLSELFPDGESKEFMKNSGFRTQVRSLRDDVVGDVMIRSLWILFGAVLVVLLVAVANLSNLFLVRIESRRREVALRAVLGADRWRAASQFLSESVLIAIPACVLAIAFAAISLRTLLAVAPTDLPRLAEVHVGGAAIMFAGGGALLLAFLLGIIPFLGSSALDLGVLRDGGRGLTVSHHRHLARNTLVVSQVAFSLVLLTAAGLMAASFRNLRAVRPGFDPRGVLTLRVALPSGTYRRPENTSPLYEQLVDRVQQMPNVVVAGLTQSLPLASGFLCTAVNVQASSGSVHGACPASNVVSPGYFEAMGIHVDGRTLTWQGMNAHDGTMVVSRMFAGTEWPDETAMDKGIKYYGTTPPFYRVAGVAADVLGDGFEKPAVNVIYFPMLPMPDAQLWGAPTEMFLVVKTKSGDPMALVPLISRALAELEPQGTVANPRTMETLVAKSMAKRTFTMLLLGVAATMALLLSVVGLYGMISYLVSQRRGEIAIRMALGAQMTAVWRMIVAHSVKLAVGGIVVGLFGAFATTRVMQSLLFGVSATNPMLMGSAALLLLAVATAAGYVPARRASRVDPAETLRSE